jgi:UDP-3-O-[3-hydroxymyristoyl] glucosamine N-acyltransferase
MRILSAVLLLHLGLAACASRSEEAEEESTRVATDTLVETREVADTLVVRTDSTIAADTSIMADTTISADTTVTADTTVDADTIRVGDEGVIRVDTVPASDTTR